MNTDESSHPPRYAFIDVQNTISTTTQLLGFTIDWQKLYRYLKDHWKCEKVFFYSGIRQGDEERVKEFQDLAALGYEVRSKFYSVYKNRDRIFTTHCSNCSHLVEFKVQRNPHWKINCDVELSVDAMSCAQEGVEYLIFTGDGDFVFLLEKLIGKGIKTYLISSSRESLSNSSTSRFSIKLRQLISKRNESLFFVDINQWKEEIKGNLLSL